MDVDDPFIDENGLRDPIANGVAVACGLLETPGVEDLAAVITGLDEQDLRDVVFTFIASQHTAVGESLESLFADQGVFLRALARMELLEGQCRVLREFAGRSA